MHLYQYVDSNLYNDYRRAFIVKNIILEAHDDGYFSLLILMFLFVAQTDAETLNRRS